MIYCRVCENILLKNIFAANILNHKIKYFECSKCGYVQTEQPFWLDEAYSSAINNYDTGIIERNRICTMRATNVCRLLNIEENDSVLDYAGGYGLFTRMMRDVGFSVFWADKYCVNLFAKHFEYSNQKIKLLTAFEVFEHFDDPIDSITQMFNISENILLSTLLIPDPTPKCDEWWYYGCEHGQHIGFFRKQTLEYIANKFGKNLYTFGNEIHIFTNEKINILQLKLYMKYYKLFFTINKRKLKSRVFIDYLMLKNNEN